MILKTPFLPFDIRLSKLARSKNAKQLGYKVFCIGRNKTGTTSIKAEFIRQGFRVGNQRTAEMLAHYYHMGNFFPIIEYCGSADIFQDVPFSWPETYMHMDLAFPDAKFILTVRDSPEQWANSVINFAKKRFGGRLPTLEDLKEYDYVYPGWSYNNRLWKTGSRGMSIEEKEGKMREEMYDPMTLMRRYIEYNHEARRYFKDRPEKLLVLNVGKPQDYKRFCTFFDLPLAFEAFPWENKT